MPSPNLIEVDNIAHELLEPYIDLRTRNWTRLSGIFIAEGPLLVERVLHGGRQIVSILLDRKYYDQYIGRIPGDVTIILVDHDLVKQIVGFNFHRGVLACGRRPKVHRLDDVPLALETNETWIGLIGIQDPENVGGILRSAAGLGVRRVLIGPGTADPLSRRALRVSMGNVLSLELFETRDPCTDLMRLRQQGVECVATSLGQDSEPLEQARRDGPLIILLGNEKYGLSPEVLAHVDRRVRIGMCLNTDSLNVSIAAAITMYHYCRIAGQQSLHSPL